MRAAGPDPRRPVRARVGSAAVGGRRRLGLVEGGGPAVEQLERVVGGSAGARRCRRRSAAGVGRPHESLAGEGEVTDGRVVEPPDPGAVEAHIVRGAPGVAVLAAGGQFADEVRQRPVTEVAAGLGAQQLLGARMGEDAPDVRGERVGPRKRRGDRVGNLIPAISGTASPSRSAHYRQPHGSQHVSSLI